MSASALTANIADGERRALEETRQRTDASPRDGRHVRAMSRGGRSVSAVSAFDSVHASQIGQKSPPASRTTTAAPTKRRDCGRQDDRDAEEDRDALERVEERPPSEATKPDDRDQGAKPVRRLRRAASAPATRPPVPRGSGPGRRRSAAPTNTAVA